MPDLTTHHVRTCSTNLRWETQVQGSQDTYTVKWERLNYAACNARYAQYDWTCTCAHFQKRLRLKEGQYCKHINEAKKRNERCAWNWELEPANEAIDDKCPKCGGETSVEGTAI